MTLDLTRFRVLTFDCYGTLIDWETGLLGALRPICDRHAVRVTNDELLRQFGEIESPLQRGRYRPYRAILADVVNELGTRLGFEPAQPERDALAESLPAWPVFPDTVEALRTLAGRYQLAIVSNTDDDLFAGTAPHLGVAFDPVVTAEQARTYKPARNNFHRALTRIGRPWNEVLHVAQSIYHDVAPAKSLGLATVWIDRRGGRSGGATPPSDAAPDLRAPNLLHLAALAEAGFSRKTGGSGLGW